jgi:Tfp pilus assembly protein PilF
MTKGTGSQSTDPETLIVNEGFAGVEALFSEGNSWLAAGDLCRAEACFREAIRLEPELAQLHTNLALLLEQQGKPLEAEHSYRRAITLDPFLPRSHLNLGALLTGQKRFADAKAACLRALELDPDFPAAWSNLGVLLACRKEEQEAEACYRQAMQLDPLYRLAQFNLSYLLLRQGRYEEGWRCLEARNWYAALERRLSSPRWQGESLKGKSLLIGFEAGHGDMIQFCRYTTLLKAQGVARMALICHPALINLFASLDGLDQLIPFDESLPLEQWDFWTPPFSLPYYCRTRLDSIPAQIPYLRADSKLVEKWFSELARECAPSDFRVGLVWQGNPDFENDAERSLPSLEPLEPLGALGGIRFFSLQKGGGEAEAVHPPAALPLVNLGPRMGDFADSAAIVANLDLVISVDTAMAHLAGALGKECWLLLPDYMTDWRWLAERNDSPWYPGAMRLFRQPPGGGWGPVVADLCLALDDLLRRRS